MRQTSMRGVAMLLIPCLLGDPCRALAEGWSQSVLPIPPSETSCQTQALTLMLLAATWTGASPHDPMVLRQAAHLSRTLGSKKKRQETGASDDSSRFDMIRFIPKPQDILHYLAELSPKLHIPYPQVSWGGRDQYAFNLEKPMKGSLLPGERLDVTGLYHGALGNVYIADTGAFLLLKSDPAHLMTLWNRGLFRCSAVLVRAIDASGSLWLGVAHLNPTLPPGDVAGKKGIAFSQFHRVLGFLKRQSFSRVQIRVILPARNVQGMPSDNDIQAGIQKYGFDALSTVRRDDNADDLLDSLNSAQWMSWSSRRPIFASGAIGIDSETHDTRVDEWPPFGDNIRSIPDVSRRLKEWLGNGSGILIETPLQFHYGHEMVGRRIRHRIEVTMENMYAGHIDFVFDRFTRRAWMDVAFDATTRIREAIEVVGQFRQQGIGHRLVELAALLLQLEGATRFTAKQVHIENSLFYIHSGFRAARRPEWFLRLSLASKAKGHRWPNWFFPIMTFQMEFKALPPAAPTHPIAAAA